MPPHGPLERWYRRRCRRCVSWVFCRRFPSPRSTLWTPPPQVGLHTYSISVPTWPAWCGCNCLRATASRRALSCEWRLLRLCRVCSTTPAASARYAQAAAPIAHPPAQATGIWKGTMTAAATSSVWEPRATHIARTRRAMARGQPTTLCAMSHAGLTSRTSRRTRSECCVLASSYSRCSPPLP
jgi:hypothetical protein